MKLSFCRVKIRTVLTWLWYWLPPLFMMAVIFYFSAQQSLPQAPGPWLDAFLKKLTHIAEYTLLFLLLVRAWRRSRVVEGALLAALLTTAAYAISDEFHQSFVPGRHANWYDVLIDVTVPLLLCLVWRGRLRRRLVGAKDPYLTK